MYDDPIGLIRVSLHVLAATIWVGGQFTLAGLVPVLRAAGGDVPKQAARAFNRIAWPAFWILVVTGIWNYLAVHSGKPSTWEMIFGIKMLFVVASGVTAWLHSHAKSRLSMAINGGLTGLTALITLVLGLALA